MGEETRVEPESRRVQATPRILRDMAGPLALATEVQTVTQMGTVETEGVRTKEELKGVRSPTEPGE